MSKAPADRGKPRGMRVSDRSWNLWQRAAEALGLTLSEYMKITMDFSSMRHLGLEEEIREQFGQLTREQESDDDKGI